MFEKLIPVYREKENFTLFYDTDKNQLFRLPHRKMGTGLYIFLFLLVLYGSQYLNDLYQPYKSPVLNIILSISLLPLCYVLAKVMHKHYYIHDNPRELYFGQDTLEKFIEQGKRQLRRELYGLVTMISLSVVCFILFFTFNQLQPLIVAEIAFMVVLLFVFMKPYSRLQLYKKIQKGEIKL